MGGCSLHILADTVSATESGHLNISLNIPLNVVSEHALSLTKAKNYYFILKSTQSISTGDDVIHVAVVTRDSSTVAKDDIVNHIKNNLAPHKHITGEVFLVDSIPHNPQGKKLRRVLKTQYLEKKLSNKCI